MDLYTKLNKPNYLFDSHCHLISKEFDEDLDEIIQKSTESSIELVLDVGVDLKTSEKSLEISQKYENIKSWIGIDPEILIPSSELTVEVADFTRWLDDSKDYLSKLIVQNKEEVIGIGETGMDFYWNKQNGLDQKVMEDSHNKQEKLFRMHLELAQEFNLPLTIHSRGAEEECLQIVSDYSTVGIFHSYTGDYETAVKILDSGWGLGVNGIATFKNAKEIREMYSKILGKHNFSDWNPEDFYKKGIYFETDAPYLSPEGLRGERNEPANIAKIYELFVLGMIK